MGCAVILLCLMAAVLLPQSLTAAEKNPNILFIVSDDQGWGDLPQNWDKTEVQLPALDALLDELGVAENTLIVFVSDNGGCEMEGMGGKYPVMKEISEFWLDHLKALPDGRLVIPDGRSPEHGPEKSDGVSYDQQLCWDLFNNTIEASAALGVDDDFRKLLVSKRDKLLGPKVGEPGPGGVHEKTKRPIHSIRPAQRKVPGAQGPSRRKDAES